MTENELQAKVSELDRLLNDPDVRLDPHRVWTLLAELSAHSLSAAATAVTGSAAPRPAR